MQIPLFSISLIFLVTFPAAQKADDTKWPLERTKRESNNDYEYQYGSSGEGGSNAEGSGKAAMAIRNSRASKGKMKTGTKGKGNVKAGGKGKHPAGSKTCFWS